MHLVTKAEVSEVSIDEKQTILSIHRELKAQDFYLMHLVSKVEVSIQVSFVFRNRREGEMSCGRMAVSSGYLVVEVPGFRDPVHPGVLDRGAGSETGLQIHPDAFEADAGRTVSNLFP